MADTGIEVDFEQRNDPIVLQPGEICEYVKICPYKLPNCYGTSENRNWKFVCDIDKLKNTNGE